MCKPLGNNLLFVPTANDTWKNKPKLQLWLPGLAMRKKAGQDLKDWSKSLGKLYGLHRSVILKICLAHMKCDTGAVLH